MNTPQTILPIDPSTVQYVVGADGQPRAVQIDISTWAQIVAFLEDAEDRAIAREALAELDAAGGNPAKAGYIPWEQARRELEADGSEE